MKSTDKTLSCAVCGIPIEYSTHGSPRKFCSQECGWKFRGRKRRKTNVTVLQLVPRENLHTSAIPEQLPLDGPPSILAPGSLCTAAVEWLKDVMETFELTATEKTLCEMAASALDAATRARE